MTNCSECTYLKVDGDKNYGKYWCDNLKKWVYATDDSCEYSCNAYGRSSSEVLKAYKYSKESQQSGCYLTTITCSILSMKDDNVYLDTMRSFRNNYLQKNEEGLKLLVEYDVVGPKISKCISEDKGKFNIAYALFNKYILPITLDIMDRKYENAIKSYVEMTEKLMKFYNISNDMELNLDEVEPSLAGHGYIQKKLA